MTSRLASFFLRPPEGAAPDPTWAPPLAPSVSHAVTAAFTPGKARASRPADGPSSARRLVSAAVTSQVDPDGPARASEARTPKPGSGPSSARRLVSAFVAPAVDPDGSVSAPEALAAGGPLERAPAPVAADAVRAVAVLGEDAVATALVVATALRRADRAVPLVVLAGSELPFGPRPPAAPGAVRLAARLAERGHGAEAFGRLVVVREDDAPGAGRAAAAAPGAVVLALGGARTDAWDRLLVGQDAIVLAPRGPLAAALLDAGAPVLREQFDAAVHVGPPDPDRRSRRALAADVVRCRSSDADGPR